MTEFNLEDVLAQLKEMTEESAKTEETYISVKQQLADISAIYNRLSKEKVRLETQIATDRSNRKHLEREAERLKRVQELEDRQRELENEFLSKAARLDELTATAKWREWALDHQIEGGKRLAVAKRGILGDKRGLGKTLTSLIWADMVEAKKILILAPNDVVPQFEDEIRSWAPGRVIFSLRGLPQSARAMIYPMLRSVDEFVITLNYEAWRKDKSIVDDLVSIGFDTVILDEAHRIKASTKQTAKGVFQIAYAPNYCETHGVFNYEGPWYGDGGLINTKPMKGYFCPSCAQPLTTTVENVLCMTGTPILNYPQELFSLLYLVDYARWPTESSFLSDYCVRVGPNQWRFTSWGLNQLSEAMSKFFLQRTRDDAGIKVPPPAVHTIEIEKDLEKYAKQYEAERKLTAEAAILLENGDRKDVFYVLEMILRERQMMVWPAGITIRDPDTKEIICNFDVQESQKLDVAYEEYLCDLIDEGERVIVFSQFVPPLKELERRLKERGTSVALCADGVSDIFKNEVREDFDLKTASKDDYKYQVCLATYKTFGTGINLNAAKFEIMLDDEWNPGMEDQAIGRIDRMNSTEQATVYKFQVKNSIDDFMASLMESKRKLTSTFTEVTMENKLRGYFNGDR